MKRMKKQKRDFTIDKRERESGIAGQWMGSGKSYIVS